MGNSIINYTGFRGVGSIKRLGGAVSRGTFGMKRAPENLEGGLQS
jgi:hypothetical protein